ncbi:uncharacterized ABC transporter ATP-binding protein/permease YOL075C [Cyclospora cayetanensis]|uniref:Uncharacterized ABC transporter ATP-binding protein/permease YOL075C n=1 Tax=Cyclospora cayetanensis TaxID=88456 RepID=A0A6P6RU52_9EIME|nr:uncharacterized ABC transporter ATP-binding protein/permease YOL075C [Cyclospora cayetanensis]
MDEQTVVHAVPHGLGPSNTPRAFTEQQMDAAAKAVQFDENEVLDQEHQQLELTLDRISCSLEPPSSLLDRVPFYSKRRRADWKTLCKTGGFKRVDALPAERVLHDVSAVCRSGSLVAIMGPSGCGKTTLMNIMSGTTGIPHTGRVCLNGRRRTKAFDRVHDVFDGNEKVIECLQFSYRLRKAIPREWGPEKRREKEHEAVQRALHILGLDGVQRSRVGSATQSGISGGQKRRLALGIGLMSDAKILLCDEPTTGLSAADAQMVVGALRRLSVECGMAIVAVVHQPSHTILGCFDHLLLLSYEGRCVYNGRVDAALEYFNALGFPCPVHQNPADFYLDLVSQSGKHASELADIYDELMKPLVEARVRHAHEHPPPAMDEIVEDVETAGPCIQFLEVTKRAFRLWLRDHTTLGAIMGDAVVQGLVIGGVFFDVQNRASVYYQLSALFLMILSLISTALWTVPLYVQQKAQYRIEISDGYYSPIPYMLGTSLVANFFVLLGDAVLVTIMWLLFRFPFVPLLVSYFVGSLGFVICDVMTAICSLASKSFAEANASSTLMLILLMFVNGFTTNPASLAAGIGWIAYFSPFFLVFEALTICILESHDFQHDPSATSGNLPLRSKEEVYHTFGIAGRAYGHTGSAIQWLWSVDVLLLLVQMVILKCLVFTLQATVFSPKRYRSEPGSTRRISRPFLLKWIAKLGRE